ncbi:MAG: hypothetical protein QXL82_00485 [Candidatus Aenigmatarchaeota archaeon]
MVKVEKKILKAREYYLKRETKLNFAILLIGILLTITFFLILINISNQNIESEQQLPNEGIPSEYFLETSEEEFPPIPTGEFILEELEI